jgi:integrase
MATFRKRGDRWRAEVWTDGKRDSGTFRSKAEARAWATRREDELGAGGRATTQRTLRDVCTAYAERVSPTHRGAKWEVLRLAKIAREFDGIDAPLRDLTAADVAGWRDARLRAVAGPSVAREMGLLRAALAHACREWQWLTRQKLDDLRGAKKPKSAPARRQRITPEQSAAIVDALGYDSGKPGTVGQRVAVAFLLALETAMRCGELCGIRSEDMELKRRFVRLPKTKNGDAREVPLTQEAVRLFRLVPNGLGLTPAQVDANFRKARPEHLRRIHFHDARAEALTRLAAKVDVLTLARIAGHRDPRSLMTYYRETAEQIAHRI